MLCSEICSYNKKLWVCFEVFVVLLTYVLLLNRAHYGIEFTDESWYIAEPYAVAEMGLIPFVNNVSQSPGFTIPLAIAYKLFVFFNGGAEGIVLFSRCFFVTVALIFATTTVFIVNRYTGWKMPVITIAPMLSFSFYKSLFDVNYYTVGIIYLPLIFACVFAEYNDESKRSVIWGMIAGALAVRSVMGTVQSVLPLVVVLFFLCLQGKKKKIEGIFAGCIAASLLVLSIPAIAYGTESIKVWLEMYLNQGCFMIEKTVSWIRTINALKEPVTNAGIAFVTYGVLRLLVRKSVVYDLLLKITILLLIVFGAGLSFLKNDYNGIGLFNYTWFVPYLYTSYSIYKSKYDKYVMVICFAYLCIYFFAAFTAVRGYDPTRAYWLLLPTMLTAVMILNSMINAHDIECTLEKIRKVFLRVGAILAIIALIAFRLWTAYFYMYRDDWMPNLNSMVESGIWKGLYTTELRVGNVVEVERYLKSVTSESDDVLCLDWVSYGYLMINGRICSPTTLDATPYTYNINTPNPRYMYFATVDKVPNKIIYIDHGRDKMISIDREDWKFNQFVNSYYHQTDSYENEVFKVRLYEIEDYEGALKIAKESAVFTGQKLVR